MRAPKKASTKTTPPPPWAAAGPLPEDAGRAQDALVSGQEQQQLTSKELNALMSGFFLDGGAVLHQIESYETFMENKMRQIIDEYRGRLKVQRDAGMMAASTDPAALSAPQRRQRVRAARGAEPVTHEEEAVAIDMSEIDGVYIARPTIREADGTRRPILPWEARLRGLTYGGEVYGTITKRTTLRRGPLPPVTDTIRLGSIPIMVGSKWCWLRGMTLEERIEAGECGVDLGAYYIINGSERTSIGQERRAHNTVFVFKGKGAASNKAAFVADIASQTPEEGKAATSLSLKLLRGKLGTAAGASALPQYGAIRAHVSFMRSDFPVFALLRSFGVATDADLADHVLATSPWPRDSPQTRALLAVLLPSFEEAQTMAPTVEAARAVVARASPKETWRPWCVEEFLQHEVLPHVGVDASAHARKACFVGRMVFELACRAAKLKPVDDRDDYRNKRGDMAGTLLSQIYRQLVKNAVRSTRGFMQREVNAGRDVDLHRTYRADAITRGLLQCMGTGNWTVSNKANSGLVVPQNNKTGVTQSLNRLTLSATVSHLRRLNTPMGRQGKIAAPRQLHASHYGLVCPSATPEGKQCGLVHNLAQLLHVSSQPSDPEPVHAALKRCPSLVRPEESVRRMRAMADASPEQRAQEDEARRTRRAQVIVDGNWVAVSENADETVAFLRGERERGSIGRDVSVAFDGRDREIRVTTDPGRLMRPLLVVDPDTQKLRVTPEDVLSSQQKPAAASAAEDEENEEDPSDRRRWLAVRGVTPEEEKRFAASRAWHRVTGNRRKVNFVDADEQHGTLIAFSPEDMEARAKRARFTHCEVHPSAQLGVEAALIPFPDHNQSPRNTYTSAMEKQALGCAESNQPVRMNTIAHTLWYPQRPLVQTSAEANIGADKLAAGQNAIVAVACYTGFNQEDSVVMNKASIDRGYGRSTVLRTFSEVESKKGPNQSQRIGRPSQDQLRGQRHGCSHKLDVDGVVPPGTPVEPEDVIIGSTLRVARGIGATDANAARHRSAASSALPPPPPLTAAQQQAQERRVDKSLIARQIDKGIVNKVMLCGTTDPGDLRMCRVQLRNQRRPQIGDKFASRHGQKGTIGMVVPEEDMPFTRDGVRPDIIMNPHAFPSRMTVGQLIECVSSKVAAISGQPGDGTAFATWDPRGQEDEHHKSPGEKAADALKALGFHPHGKERLINGMTGEPMEAMIFIGPTFYMKLKHMVDDKLHARARGPRQILTRQPVEGRGRDGGHRFGEMERDNLIAHGAAAMLKDRLFYSSDFYTAPVCNRCGLFCTRHELTDESWCGSCDGPLPPGGLGVDGVKGTNESTRVEIPYASKLFFQELMGMGLAPRLGTEATEQRREDMRKRLLESVAGAQSEAAAARVLARSKRARLILEDPLGPGVGAIPPEDSESFRHLSFGRSSLA